MTTPQRIRLSRRKGFNLQEVSRALNGLEAVKVDRSTKWGNPFVAGKPAPVALPGLMVQDRRHAHSLYRGFAPLNEKLVEMARQELRGKNLACWCDFDEDPYEDICHAAVLLEIANQEDA
jgi:hypothetical protein